MANIMDNLMGARIHRKRIEKEMTMEQLAEKLGVGKSAVNKWEKGLVKNIKRNTISQMCEIFDCSPTWLMGLDDVQERIAKTYNAVQLAKLSEAIVEEESASNEQDPKTAAALEMYEKYQKANPKIQGRIDALLEFDELQL